MSYTQLLTELYARYTEGQVNDMVVQMYQDAGYSGSDINDLRDLARADVGEPQGGMFHLPSQLTFP